MENKFNKPEVLYYDSWFIQVGCRALVSVVDHPKLEFKDDDHRVDTSIVQKYDPVTGIFETKNTIYKPNILNG